MSEGEVGARAASAIRSNAVALPLVAGLGFAGTLLVANLLTTAELAAFLVVLAIRGTVQFLTDMGTGAASSRAFARLEHTGARPAAVRLYLRLAALRAGLAALVLVLALAFPEPLHAMIGDQLATPTATALILAMVAIEVFASLGFYTLAGLLRHSTVNVIFVLQGIIQPLTVIVLVAAGFGLTGALVGLLVGSLFRGMALHWSAFRAVRAIPPHREPATAADPEFDTAQSLAPTAVAAGTGKVASFAHSRQGLSLVAASTAPRTSFVLFALAYDLGHQAITPVGGPISSVLGPALVRVDDPDRVSATVSTAVRVLLLAALGIAGAFTTLLAHADGALFGAEYRGMDPYLLIIVPAVAIELSLAVPITAAMLADDRLLGIYRRIKLVTLLLAVAYLIVGTSDLLLVLAIMATVRVASAIALAITLQRHRRLALRAAWLIRLAVAVGVAAVSAWGVAGAATGGLLGGFLGAAVFALVYLGGLRLTGLVYREDLAAFSRVIPGAQARLERVFAARSIASAT